MRSAWAAACGNPRAHWIGRRRTLIAALSGKIYVPSIFFTPSAFRAVPSFVLPLLQVPSEPTQSSSKSQPGKHNWLHVGLPCEDTAPRAPCIAPRAPRPRCNAASATSQHAYHHTSQPAHVPPQSFHTFPRASAPSVCDLPPAPLRVRAPPARSWMQCRRCRSTS